MNYQTPALVPASDIEDAVIIDPQAALSRYLRIGMITVAALVFGLFGLAAIINISGAVIAAGSVSVASKVKKIAHPTAA
jgi:HlyD family secretion protein